MLIVIDFVGEDVTHQTRVQPEADLLAALLAGCGGCVGEDRDTAASERGNGQRGFEVG